MEQSKKYRGTMAIAIVAMAFVGVAVMHSQTFLQGNVTNGGNPRTPTATDVVLTMTAPTEMNDKTRLTLKPNVTNAGSERAEKIVVRMVLPPQLSYDPKLSEKGCAVNLNVVTCPQIDYLSGNQSRALTVQLDVNACKSSPLSMAVTVPVWTIVTTSTEDMDTNTNIQQDIINVTCPPIDPPPPPPPPRSSSSSTRSSSSSIHRDEAHTECINNTCTIVWTRGQNQCTSSPCTPP